MFLPKSKSVSLFWPSAVSAAAMIASSSSRRYYWTSGFAPVQLLILCYQSSLVSSWTTTARSYSSSSSDRNSFPPLQHHHPSVPPRSSFFRYPFSSSLRRYLSIGNSNEFENDEDATTLSPIDNLPPLPRLYNMESARQPLSKQTILQLTEGQSNYLQVMRLNSHKRWGKWTGHLRLFDEDGEWLAKLVETTTDQEEENNHRRRSRKNRNTHTTKALVECIELLRSPIPSSTQQVTTHLYMGMIKKQRRKWVLEKVTELGISSISAVETEYSLADGKSKSSENWDYPKHYLQLIEAAEQCERFTIPKLNEQPLSWVDLIEKIDYNNNDGDESNNDTLWLICRERQPSNTNLIKTIQKRRGNQKNDGQGTNINVLVGPEGGWSPQEIMQFETLAEKNPVCVKLVSLGSLILRAETAAITAVATVMMSLAEEDSE